MTDPELVGVLSRMPGVASCRLRMHNLHEPSNSSQLEFLCFDNDECKPFGYLNFIGLKSQLIPKHFLQRSALNYLAEDFPEGEMRHFSAFTGKIMPGVMYVDHGYWDVYRAWYPFMSILFPERLGEILQAWVNAYKEGGWLPQFPAPGYRACMTGSLIDSVFADAAVKGIAGFDLASAFEGMKKHATMHGEPAKGYGRLGIEFYLQHHYLPADKIPQSVAETADSAYGDF